MTEFLRRYSTRDRLIVAGVAVAIAEVIWLLLSALHTSLFVAQMSSVLPLAVIVLGAQVIHQRLTAGQPHTSSSPGWLTLLAVASGVGAAALLFDVRLSLGWVELIVLGYACLLTLVLRKTPLRA
jgi:hypothetical protein